MAIDTKKYDDIFKAAVDKQGLGVKHMMVLKAQAQTESTWNPRAYRFEPAFYKGMVKGDAYWADKDPSIVSASYGLAQILFTTAWAMGMKPANWKKMCHAEFQQLAEQLYKPEVSIDLQARLMSTLIQKVWELKLPQKWEHISALDMALARYNGGSKKKLSTGEIVDKNPDANGILDQQAYVDKVWRAHKEILAKEKA